MKREISDETVVTIAKIVYFLVRMLIPLVIGHFFGIVAERIAYGLIIMRLCFFLTNALDIIQSAENYARFVEFLDGDDDDEWTEFQRELRDMENDNDKIH